MCAHVKHQSWFQSQPANVERPRKNLQTGDFSSSHSSHMGSFLSLCVCVFVCGWWWWWWLWLRFGFCVYVCVV